MQLYKHFFRIVADSKWLDMAYIIFLILTLLSVVKVLLFFYEDLYFSEKYFGSKERAIVLKAII